MGTQKGLAKTGGALRRADFDIESVRRRLLARAVPAPGGCLVWHGCEVGSGYGALGVAGERHYVHRLAFVVWRGDLEAGEVVRHSCSTPRCFAGAHLEKGTQADNMADLRASGRARNAGALNNRRLTPQQVKLIRRLYASGRHTQAELGRRFGVTQPAIGFVVRGLLWREVSP